MNCRKTESMLMDLLLEPETADAAIKAHLAGCDSCRKDLDELRQTMGLLDAWQAPEVSPYFDTRLAAKLDEARREAPQGFWKTARSWWMYSVGIRARSVTASALTLTILAGGATYMELGAHQKDQPQSAIVHDLQSFDRNQAVMDELASLDSDLSASPDTQDQP